MLAHGTLWSYISVSSAIMFIIVVCTTSCGPVLGIKCPPCDKIHCTTRRASRLQCKGGVTTGRLPPFFLLITCDCVKSFLIILKLFNNNS